MKIHRYLQIKKAYEQLYIMCRQYSMCSTIYSTIDPDIATNHGVNKQTNYELKSTHREARSLTWLRGQTNIGGCQRSEAAKKQL